MMPIRMNTSSDRIKAVVILALMVTLLIVCFVERGYILSFAIHFRESKIDYDELFFRIIGSIIIIIQMIFFGVLGYRKALQKNANPIWWTIICAITSVWGYLWLLFFINGNRSYHKHVDKNRNKLAESS